MLSVRKIAVASLVFLVVFGISLLFVSCHVNTGADKPGQVFKLDAILTGEDILYERYKDFKEKYYNTGPDKNYEPLEGLKVDSKGGEVKYNEETVNAGMCIASFKWKFDKDIREVKAGGEIGVTLSYSIEKEKCVKDLPLGWMAFTLSDGHYEQFLQNDIEEKLKEKYAEAIRFESAPEGDAVELRENKAKASANFKIRFPEKIEPGTYFALRFTVFRYYFPNTPVAAYVFEAS